MPGSTHPVDLLLLPSSTQVDGLLVLKMSFGVGVGDIIAVANIANKVRKRFVDSPDQFKAVADE